MFFFQVVLFDYKSFFFFASRRTIIIDEVKGPSDSASICEFERASLIFRVEVI